MTDPNRTQLGSPAFDPNRTVIGSPTTLTATQTIKPIQCPICKTFNPPGMIFCSECGLIFESALPADAFGAPAVQLPVLVDQSGREYPIRAGENVVGREADIMISDPQVSRRQAMVVNDSGNLTIEDLGSTNGTYLNGERLSQGSPVHVAQGDSISFGEFEVKVSMPGYAGQTQTLRSNKTAAMSTPPRVEATPGQLVGEGSSYPLKFGINSFGRRDENDVVIVDPYVSSRHGVIELTEDGVFVTDVGSTNGTMLNDAKLSPNMRTKVDQDDEIRLGALVFKVVLAEKSGADQIGD